MPHDALDELIRETEQLDERARAVQGPRELLVSQTQLNELINDYQAWYARAISVLPTEFHEKFKDLYEGGMFVKRIKAFLDNPGQVSSLFQPDQASQLFPYWENPFETTFHSSMLEQRQLLILAKQVVATQTSASELDLVARIGRGLPALVGALKKRHDKRPPLEVADEYDVQDLLGGVLRMVFGDVRAEDPSPTRAGGSSRIDFVLKEQRIVVEVKMTRTGLADRAVGDQLIEDIERYRSHPDCDSLVAIVYDPERRITNPRGLENDLGRDDDGLVVRVVVTS